MALCIFLIGLFNSFCRWCYLSLAFISPGVSLECALLCHTNAGDHSSVEVIHVMDYNFLSSVCCQVVPNFWWGSSWKSNWGGRHISTFYLLLHTIFILCELNLEVHPHIKMTSRHHWNPHQIQFPQTKYGVQEEIEGRNVSATSIWFSRVYPPEVGDNLAANRREEVIVHDMNDFSRRMISSIRVTEEGALRLTSGKRNARER